MAECLRTRVQFPPPPFFTSPTTIQFIPQPLQTLGLYGIVRLISTPKIPGQRTSNWGTFTGYIGTPKMRYPMSEQDVIRNIENYLPKPHDYKYEERLVAYIDIMGWGAATNGEEITSAVKQALALFDEPFNFTSASFREKVDKELGPGKNPFYKDIECGIYSDGILISMPADNGPRIFSIGNICRKLIEFGFLCRGGITRGLCYHSGNRALGPAINEAVALEKKAKLPRIICSTKVLDISNTGYLGSKFISIDPDGLNILNLFPSIVLKNSATIGRTLELSRITNAIKSNILGFKWSQDENAKKHLEYWEYAQSLMKSQIQESICHNQDKSYQPN